jgi:hypothetical protein|tara:strand:+ start:103 stop:438 length:336 start_codon:yes stop_codon:yes gene_type:complete
MVKNMNTETTMEKVNEWMAENADHPLLSNVQGLIEDYERTGLANFLNASLALTKTVRQKIVLSQEDVVIRDSDAQAIFEVVEKYPSFAMPRNRSLESLQEAIGKAIKQNKR